MVVLPVVVYLLHGVLDGRAEHRAQRRADRAPPRPPGSKDLDAAALLLTTQEQVAQTVAGVANYGGSLDVIVDDAEEEHDARCDRRRHRA